ncbi:MAG: radical SAM protein, partial [Proteobacteria bacterium]|nr:radical SAM protein [Pseudomonadota bacterium]
MRDSLPLLVDTDFPALRRGRLDTLQVNVGYRCNQSCLHCHVNAGPTRTEVMPADVARVIVRYLDVSEVST